MRPMTAPERISSLGASFDVNCVADGQCVRRVGKSIHVLVQWSR